VARFTTNPGTISGPTTVRYAEDGSLLEFRMAVENLEAETPTAGSDSLFVFVNMLPIPLHEVEANEQAFEPARLHGMSQADVADVRLCGCNRPGAQS